MFVVKTLSKKTLYLATSTFLFAVGIGFGNQSWAQDKESEKLEANVVSFELSEPWDWLQMSSGEWLKGELTAMENFVAYFDSDDLGDLNIDWEDVQAIHTSRVLQVFSSDLSVITGPLRTRDGEIYVASQDRTIALHEVLTIATGSKKRRDLWSGDIGASTTFRKGNIDSKDVTASADFLRRTLKTSLRLSYVGNFSEDEGEETANDHRASMTFDYRQSKKWFWRPAFAEYYRDPIQNLESQITAGVGAGYYIAENYDLIWSVSSGPAYQHTEYETEAESSLTFYFQTRYDQSITDDIDVKATYQVIAADEESGGARQHANFGFSIDLTDSLDLDIDAYWDKVGNPRADEEGILPEENDYRLVVGVSYEL